MEEYEYAKAKKTKRKANVRYEVDYIEDDPLRDNDEFDILYWWKKDIKYPTLKVIARHILAIPVSIVASGSTLNTEKELIILIALGLASFNFSSVDVVTKLDDRRCKW